MSKPPLNIFWFRRDFRLDDNRGLHEALNDDLPVLPVFIFDSNILDDLEDKADARLSFIHKEVTAINETLKEKGSGIRTFYGKPTEIWKKILREYNVKTIFLNRDYEPYATTRDEEVKKIAEEKGVEFKPFKDHVILEPHEVLKDDGNPYVVFTPFSKRWKEVVTEKDLVSVPSALYFTNFVQLSNTPVTALSTMGFQTSGIEVPSGTLEDALLEKYAERRDHPAIEGTSRLGIHLRFGTVSIRNIAQRAREKSSTFLNELIWREFYQMILWHFPRVVNENFKKQYNSVQWRNDPNEFQAWCEGKTGYPIVDAGMRQLNETGYMHNRVRMIVASFLTKHLLIDWRWGEAYFARKLLDYELASNNGGWQWAAGTGTDAQPYFRIFNPESQTRKFDPELKYIKRWVPDFQELAYPKPVVDHKYARERCLETFKEALS